MGALLAVPLGYFISLVASATPDVFYWLKYIISHIYLYIYHRSNGRRLDFYDYAAVNDPYKLGFLVPPMEAELERPHGEAHLHNAADEVFFYGVNSKSECLVVRVARSCNEEAEAWVYLKLSNGKSYQLHPEASQHQSGDKNVFSSGGLKIQCLSPMRGWRICYNGLLRETSKYDPEEEEIVHVKFSFIWAASSDVFDMTSDLNLSLLAEALAAEKWKWPVPPVKRLYEMFDCYAQSGMLMGTATIEGEEREINLWGSRSRFLGQTSHIEGSQFFHILGSVKNGSIIHLGKTSVPTIAKDLHFGYVVQSNSHLRVLEKAKFILKGEELLEESCQEIKVNFTAGLSYEMEVKLTEPATFCPRDKGWGGNVSFSCIDFTINALQGSGLVICGKAAKESPRKKNSIIKPHMPRVIPLVVPFTEGICQLEELTGGKGSSLGKLTQISEEDQRFVVPKGVVVTTAAYDQFLQGDILEGIRALENIAYGKSSGNLKAICETVSKHIADMPISDKILCSIETSLSRMFGESLNTGRFAVRSSATGEDTEQMSAAGQMETFLGVKGLKEILQAVKKSWASQFGFVAIQYKRRYGQIFNAPMAVVIQEMVPCTTAGVMFTCDPLTCNPTFINISANYGLGESVVSATSEPDTVVLRRDVNDKLSLHSITVGSKILKIVMDESGGTKEEKIPDDARDNCCLSEEQSLLLGSIGISVEKSYYSLRDIEWGIAGNQIYLLQSRPVTTGDRETDFEITHEHNAALRCEDEYLTVCNVGEVMPGAISTLGLDILEKYLAVAFKNPQTIRRQGDRVPLNKYFKLGIYPWYNHMMFNLMDMVFRQDSKNSSIMKANMVGMFGRILDDKDMFTVAADRHRGVKGGMPRWAFIKLFWDLFFAGFMLEKTKKEFETYRIPVEDFSTAKELYKCLTSSCSDLRNTILRHMECSFSSSIWNISLLSTLANTRGGFDTEVFSDFADLLATCTNVESADVPAAIQSLAYTIAQTITPAMFKSMTPEEALTWLQTSDNSAASKFEEFLSKHGHRCLKEFDLHSMPWGTNPLPLVKMLQGITGSVTEDLVKKRHIDVNEIISKLHVPLTFKTKLFLKFLLPQCRRGVRQRESSKSLIIKGMNSWRQAYNHLAELMVFEGLLPEAELLFFFTLDELGELLETRSPKLIAKANHRRRLLPELDRYIFPEIMKGIPKPINETTYIENGSDVITLMRGVPVSQGVTTGYARVAMNLEEAASLKPAEILITYSTDIGWSPYFPVLAGVVTELGGLISHGAVVAREYGLPCVVGLHGATQIFHTGDFVLLDGNKGILKKINPPTVEDQ